MPSLYRSLTAATSLDALPPTLRDAVRAHAAARQFDLAGARCWLTHSTNPPGTGVIASLFGRRANPADPDLEHWTLVALHPTQLVMATLGEKRGCSVLSLPLASASVSRHSALLQALGGDAPSDSGMYVSGLPGDAGRPGTFMVKLGDDPDGTACYAAVEAAIATAKRGGSSAG